MAITLDPRAMRGNPGAKPPLPLLALVQVAAANAVATWWAAQSGWPLLMLVVPFWLQSVVIGWFYRRRILALVRFRTDGFEMDGKPVPETAETRRTTANFLAMHYGFFHAVYAVFLVAFGFAGTLGDTSGLTREDVWAVLGLGLLFGATQYLEHRRAVATDRGLAPNIGAMMFLPYVRVVPMHLMILVGAALGSGPSAIVVFGTLKGAADVLMLVLEERLVAKSGG